METVTLADGDMELAGKIQGKVVAISDIGAAVTDIAIDQLKGVPTDEQVSICCEGHVTTCIFSTQHGQPEMTYLAMRGASGYVELTLVGDSVATFLGIGPGSDVVVTWE